MKFKNFRCVCSFLLVLLAPILLKPNKVLGQDQQGKSYQQAQKLFLTANKQAEQGHYPEAVQNYRKSIKSNPLLPAPHYNLANVLVAMGKLDEAVKEYQSAIKINPLIPDYHRNLGFAYALMKKGPLAKKKYEDLKKLDSTQADILMQWIKSGQ